MIYKFNLGDLVFMNNFDSPTNAGILHITEREIKKYDEDLMPHKYYHGFAFGLGKDFDSGLYVPLDFITKPPLGFICGAVWSPWHRESELGVINSKKVNLSKLLPYITQL